VTFNSHCGWQGTAFPVLCGVKGLPGLTLPVSSAELMTMVLEIVYGCLCAVLCTRHLGIEACMGFVVRRVHVSGCGHRAQHVRMQGNSRGESDWIVVTDKLWCKQVTS
jgi:hypothetical protein